MSDASTNRIIGAYEETSEAPMFLSGFFRTPPENIHDTESVELDIMRDDEDVAVVITDLAGGARQNEATKYSNKSFTPPVYNEEGAITAYSLIKRQFGENPFANPDFGAIALKQSFGIFGRLTRKIRRAIELMSSQVFQNGVLTLVDGNGVAQYTLDFQAKASHFVTTTPWADNGSTGDPLTDIENLATIVRRDGKVPPTKLIFGAAAMRKAMANAKFLAALDKTVLNLGALAPETRGQGATYRGRVWIGHYPFEIWMYDGFYRPADGGSVIPYVGTNNVIMLSDGARLDLTFGSLPSFTRPEQRALSFLPDRISSEANGFAFTTNSWLTPDGTTLKVSAGTRPLTIPTAIDTFGRLTVS